jgi:NTE family protein
MARGLLACVLTLALWGCSTVSTVPGSPESVPQTPQTQVQPRLGLALGGGAARGFAHIGVLQVLEEAGIRPDLVVGTSAGSVVAALYAGGFSAAQLQTVAQGMDEASLSDWRLPLFRPGVLKGEALARFVSRQLRGRAIQDLPMPLGVVATDLHSGQPVLFQRGDAASAVRASSAIPALFEPVSIAGRVYVDGGLVSPVPVRFARQMGADLVLAIDISSAPQSQPVEDTFQMLMQTFAIMGQSLNSFELGQADVVVKPNLSGLPSASFSARTQAIAAGRAAMLAALPALQARLR